MRNRPRRRWRIGRHKMPWLRLRLRLHRLKRRKRACRFRKWRRLFFTLGRAGDEHNCLHVDSGGCDSGHCAFKHVENEGNPIARSKRDGVACGRLGGFDGERVGAKGRRWVFPYAMTFFHFHLPFQSCGFVAGHWQHRFGRPNKNSLLPFGVNEITTPFFRPPTTRCESDSRDDVDFFCDEHFLGVALQWLHWVCETHFWREGENEQMVVSRLCCCSSFLLG